MSHQPSSSLYGPAALVRILTSRWLTGRVYLPTRPGTFVLHKMYTCTHSIPCAKEYIATTYVLQPPPPSVTACCIPAPHPIWQADAMDGLDPATTCPDLPWR